MYQHNASDFNSKYRILNVSLNKKLSGTFLTFDTLIKAFQSTYKNSLILNCKLGSINRSLVFKQTKLIKHLKFFYNIEFYSSEYLIRDFNIKSNKNFKFYLKKGY